MPSIGEIVKDVIASNYEYLSQCEKDSTEMARYIAALQANTHELSAQREIAKKYFENNMAERERLFNSASQVLDKAIKTGDPEFAEIATRVIGVVHQKSPFSF